ncbi:hypothetical protein Ahy_B03g062274 [Arachis hypogaea]|uniref:Uncharacterized protein n=1 Tax=Arachis hypogaea TaxID=3818 RepID=A0A444ZTT8_ARAHY|nr:hypothetical protein Ahy_B03g062274 [Arachis hypogaea]
MREGWWIWVTKVISSHGRIGNLVAILSKKGSMQWRAEFSNGYVKHLDDMGSDYKPLLIDSDREVRRNEEEIPISREMVVELIKHTWTLDMKDSPMFRLVRKLKTTRHCIVKW